MSHISLSSAPWGEECAQLGRPGYFEQAQHECAVYIEQLLRRYRAAHDSDPLVRLVIADHPHEFGTYHEVSVVFDMDDPAAVHDATWFEDNEPENWDEEARLALGLSEEVSADLAVH